jgi:hypothetical protein
VCGLTGLQQLSVNAVTDVKQSCVTMFKGALPAAMTQLTALRRLEVLGMDDKEARDDDDQLRLADMPALETAALRMRTLIGRFPGLCEQQQVVMSRLVSLSLALRVETYNDEPYPDTCLPIIIAPAMTELVLDDILLAPCCEQLSWLPGLPQLRRLVLRDIKTAANQLPDGVIQCSRLTELVLRRFQVNYDGEPDDGYYPYWPSCKLCSLPGAGPYLSQLVHLSLAMNGFSAVPPSLAAASALEILDLNKQSLRAWSCDQHEPPVQGLHVLDTLPRLRCVNLVGFKKSGAGICRAAHPTVEIS